MAHKFHEELMGFSDYLQGGIDSTDAFPGELVHLKLKYKQQLKNMQLDVHRYLGISRSGATGTPHVGLPPLTHVMGEIIIFDNTPVKAEQYTPSFSDIEKLQKAVEGFRKDFPAMTNDEIIASSKMNGGALLVRKLAQITGIKDVNQRSIDASLIDEIRAALPALEANEREMAMMANSLSPSAVEIKEMPGMPAAKRK